MPHFGKELTDICKMLLTEFSGEIWLKSKVGKGTTFFFSLPAISRQKQEK